MSDKTKEKIMDECTVIIGNFIDSKIRQNTDEGYKEMVIELLQSIDNHLEQNRAVLESFKEDELTFNALEVEGGVRALIALQSDVAHMWDEIK